MPMEDPNNLGYRELEGDLTYYAIISSSFENAQEYSLFLSDFFQTMNTLFPQKDVATGYADSPFLKVGGEDALPFLGTNTLEKKHEIFWRGRNDNLAGKSYRDFPGAFPRQSL